MVELVKAMSPVKPRPMPLSQYFYSTIGGDAGLNPAVLFLTCWEL